PHWPACSVRCADPGTSSGRSSASASACARVASYTRLRSSGSGSSRDFGLSRSTPALDCSGRPDSSGSDGRSIRGIAIKTVNSQARFSRRSMSSAAQFITLNPVSRSLSPEQNVATAAKPPDLVVIMPVKDWVCARCGGTGDLLTMDDAGPLCMTCADLDHLVFLGAGDAALTRRAKKASVLSAVVVRWSRSRKRYE